MTAELCPHSRLCENRMDAEASLLLNLFQWVPDPIRSVRVFAEWLKQTLGARGVMAVTAKLDGAVAELTFG